jgi:hypothetical protein
MARNISIGDTVYVPCSKIEALADSGVALKKVSVVEISGRSVTVDILNHEPIKIASSLVHKDVGILIVNIGDFDTEFTLLDPLAKSILQFCRLLVDDQVRSERVRSVAELQKMWAQNQAAYSHVIWIGHGRKDAIKFAVDQWVDCEKLSEALRVRAAPQKTYISLCCNTGYRNFGGNMSSETICQNFIGPFHSVSGAVASQFCQTFLTYHFLEGRSVGVAFRNARSAVPGGVSFRLWEGGRLRL